MLFLGEVEQLGKRLAVWKAGVGVAKLVEVRVEKASKGSRSSLWIVLEEVGYEVNGLTRSAVTEHLLPGQRSNLRESVFFVVRVHGLDLLLGGSSKDLNDFNQLVDTTFTRENRLSKHKLSDDTADRPHINRGGVV